MTSEFAVQPTSAGLTWLPEVLMFQEGGSDQPCLRHFPVKTADEGSPEQGVQGAQGLGQHCGQPKMPNVCNHSQEGNVSGRRERDVCWLLLRWSK